MPKTTTKPDRLKQAHDKLQAAVESIVTSEDWAASLVGESAFGRTNRLVVVSQSTRSVRSQEHPFSCHAAVTLPLATRRVTWDESGQFR